MLKLRTADVGDGKALADIYKYYVDNTSISFEYIAPDEAEFSERIRHKMTKYPFLVAEYNGTIAGYAYASEFRERAAYQWSAELSIYISPDNTGKVIGTRLYSALLDILKLQNFVTVYAGITYPNEKSVNLHKKLGFRHLGTFCAVGYKNEKWRDVMWYGKQINEHTPPLPIIPFPALDKNIVDKILNQKSEV